MPSLANSSASENLRMEERGNLESGTGIAKESASDCRSARTLGKVPYLPVLPKVR